MNQGLLDTMNGNWQDAERLLDLCQMVADGLEEPGLFDCKSKLILIHDNGSYISID